eukprot:TRINITY_DN5162_c0_g1_i1.p1 TRINITY_DN5162_c0_g1~~TRINITY_DN5162_c0_g1_i1.p1  ORF type:complete len:336 (-),score=92.90 TRINITY_DN5162_c0_g1_i1:35-1042(-)
MISRITNRISKTKKNSKTTKSSPRINKFNNSKYRNFSTTALPERFIETFPGLVNAVEKPKKWFNKLVPNSKEMCVYFVGGGNMAQALIGGLYEKNIKIVTIDPEDGTRSMLESKYGVCTSKSIADSDIESEADVVVLAVKPQIASSVFEELADVKWNKQTIVSLMAGINLDAIKESIPGEDLKYIRTMPNTPSLIGKGVTGVYVECEESKEITEELLGDISSIHYIPDEDSINKVAAISGSGPAYFFAFMESLMKAGKEMGLSEDMSHQLVIDTAVGAAEIAKGSDSVQLLRERVTRKGDSTEKGLEVFKEDDMDKTVKRVVDAALKRGRELSKL